MIQLRADCLIIRTSDGEQIPCPAERLTIELLGESARGVEPDLIQHAAAAVLYYFKHEHGQEFVSVEEFARAFEKVLRGLGVGNGSTPAPPPWRVEEMDLCQFASEVCEAGELFFFPNVRQELERRLEGAPQVVRLRGLRPCVKQLTGMRRWNPRCQGLSDQIVEFLRMCWSAKSASQCCALVVM